MTPEERAAKIEAALLTLADNVAKHMIQRDGWIADDKCFQVDLRASQEIIMEMLRAERRKAMEEDAEIADGLAPEGLAMEVAAAIRAAMEAEPK